MTIRSVLTPLLAVAISTAPIAAQAETRAASPTHQAEKVEGDSTWIWIGVAVVALVVILLVADDNHHHHPASP